MTELMAPKAVLHKYLSIEREQLLSKLDGLSEREMRWPMTASGTNLLGIAKHVASVQIGYLGEVFGRPADQEMPWFAENAEVNADMWATADESSESIIDFYRQSCEHADGTLEALELDAVGEVPWWPSDRRKVTLQQILVHLTVEIARHAGHADILRETIDNEFGNDDGNVPEQTKEEWIAYRKRLEHAAVAADRASQTRPA